jgi:hypothetical protein
MSLTRTSSAFSDLLTDDELVNHSKKMRQIGEYGSHIEIAATSRLLKCKICSVIVNGEDATREMQLENTGEGDFSIYLLFTSYLNKPRRCHNDSLSSNQSWLENGPF